VHILQPEWCVVACGPGVLPQPNEEEKCNSNHISNGLGVLTTRNAVCLSKDVYDDNNVDWNDSFGRRVLPLVCPDLLLDSEIDVTVDVFSDIRGPHPGERLTDRTQCVLHCSSSHGVVAGGNAAVAVALTEDLQDGDWVVPGPEKGVDAIFQAKFVPTLPILVLGFGAPKSDSGFDLVVNSAEVSAEDIGLRNWQSVHGKIWGNLDSNKVNS
jgi:hypothetical protein